MIFCNMLKGQRLILIKPLKQAPQPTSPLLATSATKLKMDPLWLVILLSVCAGLKPLLCNVNNKSGQIGADLRRLYRAIRPKITMLGFLAGVVAAVILESVATNYLERCLGAI